MKSFTTWLKLREGAEDYKQILIKGYVILPFVTQGDFDRLPMDGMYGGDHWDKKLKQWIPQEKTPRPQVVWPENEPFWIVLDNQNRIISQEPMTSPLPNIPKINVKKWNQEWGFAVDHDV